MIGRHRAAEVGLPDDAGTFLSNRTVWRLGFVRFHLAIAIQLESDSLNRRDTARPSGSRVSRSVWTAWSLLPLSPDWFLLVIRQRGPAAAESRAACGLRGACSRFRLTGSRGSFNSAGKPDAVHTLRIAHARPRFHAVSRSSPPTWIQTDCTTEKTAVGTSILSSLDGDTFAAGPKPVFPLCPPRLGGLFSAVSISIDTG